MLAYGKLYFLLKVTRMFVANVEAGVLGIEYINYFRAKATMNKSFLRYLSGVL
jgi:hypothetical protein